MLVKELHIGVEQAINKVAASTNRSLFAEQIDLFLNKAQDEYVRMYVQDKEAHQVQLDRVRPFIVARDVPVRGNFLILPSDYAYLLADMTYLSSPAETTKVALIASMVKGIPDTIIDSVTNRTIYTKPTGNIDPFILRAGMLYELRSRGYEAYTDTYLPTDLALYGTIEADSTLVVKENSRLIVEIEGNSSILTKEAWSVSVNYNGKRVPNSLTKSTQAHLVNSTPYYGTSKNVVNTLLHGNTIEILPFKKDVGCIVSGGRIDYIRKPRPICLALDFTSEIPVQFHNELVDITAELIVRTFAGKPLNSQ